MGSCDSRERDKGSSLEVYDCTIHKVLISAQF